MYRGFKLNTEFLIHIERQDHYEIIGKDNKNQIHSRIKKTLDNYLLPDKKIDASKIQEDWFPQVGAHIFLSHSHSDEKEALILSGFLKEHLKIDVFIDSSIWGYANDLLREINNEYNKNQSGHYKYDESNWSASNVYLMLANALNKMIDNTECIFFLNTPNSLNTSDVENQKSKTGSPWIYSELNTTQIIRRQKRKTNIKKAALESKDSKSNFEPVYEVETKHLKDISIKNIEEWFKTTLKNGENNLDRLYGIVK